MKYAKLNQKLQIYVMMATPTSGNRDVIAVIKELRNLECPTELDTIITSLFYAEKDCVTFNEQMDKLRQRMVDIHTALQDIFGVSFMDFVIVDGQYTQITFRPLPEILKPISNSVLAIVEDTVLPLKAGFYGNNASDNGIRLDPEDLSNAIAANIIKRAVAGKHYVISLDELFKGLPELPGYRDLQAACKRETDYLVARYPMHFQKVYSDDGNSIMLHVHRSVFCDVEINESLLYGTIRDIFVMITSSCDITDQQERYAFYLFNTDYISNLVGDYCYPGNKQTTVPYDVLVSRVTLIVMDNCIIPDNMLFTDETGFSDLRNIDKEFVTNLRRWFGDLGNEFINQEITIWSNGGRNIVIPFSDESDTVTATTKEDIRLYLQFRTMRRALMGTDTKKEKLPW